VGILEKLEEETLHQEEVRKRVRVDGSVAALRCGMFYDLGVTGCQSELSYDWKTGSLAPERRRRAK
jgi:hypothetical protein